VDAEVSFRWGSLMGEKRIVRSSYGDARPRRDFPWLAREYLRGRLNLDDLITRRITLGEIVPDAGIARGHVFTIVVCRPDLAVVALADLATPEGPPAAVSTTLARAGLRHVVIDPARLPRRDAVRALLALD
jgi:hypothetical protein